MEEYEKTAVLLTAYTDVLGSQLSYEVSLYLFLTFLCCAQLSVCLTLP